MEPIGALLRKEKCKMTDTTIKRKYQYSFEKMAVLCPCCSHVSKLGKIRASIHMKLDPMCPETMIEMYGRRLVNYPFTYEEMIAETPITFICPDCGTHMIMLDDGIAELAATLNKNRIFTISCCEGHDRNHDGICDEDAYLIFGEYLPKSLEKYLNNDHIMNKLCADTGSILGIGFRDIRIVGMPVEKKALILNGLQTSLINAFDLCRTRDGFHHPDEYPTNLLEYYKKFRTNEQVEAGEDD
jgi:Zn finger protein HypA/HybF involved in hydrogenase expression